MDPPILKAVETLHVGGKRHVQKAQGNDMSKRHGEGTIFGEKFGHFGKDLGQLWHEEHIVSQIFVTATRKGVELCPPFLVGVK